MPNTDSDVALKKVKDFNEEEKAAILERAKELGILKVAEEFGTTWQVVSAIRRAANQSTRKAKVKPVTKRRTSAKRSRSAKPIAKKSGRATAEERLEILKRASEIGVTQAADEAGVSKWTVFQWRKLMRKAGQDVPKAPRVRTEAPKAPTAKSKSKSAITKVVAETLNSTETALNFPANKSGVYSQIELENEMLKQQVANLSQQVNKLRAALSQLAQ